MLQVSVWEGRQEESREQSRAEHLPAPLPGNQG